jgi:hypothetical protein
MRRHFSPSLLRKIWIAQMPTSVRRAADIYKADSSCPLCRWQARFTKLPTDSKANMPLAASLHGKLGVSETDKSHNKWLRKSSMTFAFSRDAPQKPIKVSLELVFESSSQTVFTYECSLAAITWTVRGLCFRFDGLQEISYSLLRLLAKMGNSSPLASHDFGEANTHSQRSTHRCYPYLLLSTKPTTSNLHMNPSSIFGSKSWFHHFPAVRTWGN